MDFMILNRRDAKRYSYLPHEKSSAMISIYSSDEIPNHFKRHPSNGIRYILPIQFDDVDRAEPFAMTEDDANQIAEFVMRVKSQVNRIIVHCDAGISRSAGVCAAIEKMLTGSDMRIFSDPGKHPNMHCYRLTLQALIKTKKQEERTI